MSTIGNLDEAIATGLVPETPQDLKDTMEGLPGFCDTLAAKVDGLAEFAGGTVGDRTSTALTDMAQAVSRAAAAAREAFTAYQDESSGWR
jgi:hypothetical protein